jgi:hypothetical protein
MKKIVDIKIVQRPDPVDDGSQLGKYTDEWSEHAIDRKERGDWHQGQFRCFIPATIYPEYADADYIRAEAFNNSEWSYVGVQAVAPIETNGLRNTLTSGGLWGIESDSDPEYFAEVGAEEVEALRDVLLELGFSVSEIEQAARSEVTA